jgi:DNA-binding response OmpR family regulator
MAKILIVEDDPEIIESVRFYLRKRLDFQLTGVPDAIEALNITEKTAFDLILLDIMLPGISGIDLCVQLRHNMFCPIIFISSLDDDETIVKSLNYGGDDYLVKPFTGPVLIARLDANLRRCNRLAVRNTDNIQIGDISLDCSTHIVRKGNTEIYLSPTEFEILYFMMNHRGEILEMETIYYFVWHRPSCGDVRTISVHVSNLRKKIEDSPNNPVHIKTVRRLGYQFE